MELCVLYLLKQYNIYALRITSPSALPHKYMTQCETKIVGVLALIWFLITVGTLVVFLKRYKSSYVILVTLLIQSGVLSNILCFQRFCAISDKSSPFIVLVFISYIVTLIIQCGLVIWISRSVCTDIKNNAAVKPIRLFAWLGVAHFLFGIAGTIFSVIGIGDFEVLVKAYDEHAKEKIGILQTENDALFRVLIFSVMVAMEVRKNLVRS
jgi:hypothetical protein